MENFFYSFISGLFCVGGLFILSCVTVVGVKFLWGIITSFLTKEPTALEAPVKKRRRKKRAPPPTPSPIRSIEINPEEIDRIYVRKSS